MSTRALANRPAAAIVARAVGSTLPVYVNREQARAIINAAETTAHRLLLECFWQSGGRVSEVLRLRPCDVDTAERALVLRNLKQRTGPRAQKKVYVSTDLVAALGAFARDTRLRATACYFRSARSGAKPMTRQQCWRLITRYAERAGVYLADPDGELRPASGLNFRHGSAIHQLRSGVPITEVGQQLGHARLDTTMIYTRLSDGERRRYADGVAW